MIQNKQFDKNANLTDVLSFFCSVNNCIEFFFQNQFLKGFAKGIVGLVLR